MEKNSSDKIIRNMFGISVRILVTLLFTIELYQCVASTSEEALQSVLPEPVVANRGDFTYQAS